MIRLVIVTATTDNTLKVSLVETSLAYDCLMVISAASEDSVGAILVCYLQVASFNFSHIPFGVAASCTKICRETLILSLEGYL